MIFAKLDYKFIENLLEEKHDNYYSYLTILEEKQFNHF